jgi:methionyl-tRNA synthetase
MKNFYLTTTIPYVNDAPHIGFALELVQADALARYHELDGDAVIFNMGTDEHGQKIYRAAEKAGKSPKEFADEYAPKFEALRAALNVSWNRFVRTTDPHHESAAQEFWRRCEAAGDIYKKQYAVTYCVGCEMEKTDSELDASGHCLLHPTLEIEIINEENYFFRLSKYQQQLLELYEKHPDFIVPEARRNEFRTFVANGLQDFSISRLKEKMPWGVPVPGDDAHVMYVWFDALVNYISTLGWPEDTNVFEGFWGTPDAPNALQFAGKDQVRPQAIMWQGMLLSAKLPRTKQIFYHGFINSDGQRMSKSLGNVVDPFELVRRYGTDAVRYFLLRHIHPTEDSDFTLERFHEAYTAGLVNGLGNLVSRVLKMAAMYDVRRTKLDTPQEYLETQKSAAAEIDRMFAAFEFNKLMGFVWREIADADQFIQQTEPFKKAKTDLESARQDVSALLSRLNLIACMLAPLLPNTSTAILDAIRAGGEIPAPLFPRLPL